MSRIYPENVWNWSLRLFAFLLKRGPKKVKVSESLYQMLYPKHEQEERQEEEEDNLFMKLVTVDGIEQMVNDC